MARSQNLISQVLRFWESQEEEPGGTEEKVDSCVFESHMESRRKR
jgi:hypothetical protein